MARRDERGDRSSGAGSATPLIGRRAELEQIIDALADDACRGIVLRGAPGVGKSRLGVECLAVAEAHGLATRRVLATASTQSVPLGAMAGLIPPLGPEANPLGAARRELRAATAGAGRLVLLVDDAQWLDDTSAALVHHAVVDGDVVAVLTIRQGEAVPAAIEALGRDPAVRRIDVGPLGDREVAELAAALLAGEAATALVDRVVELAGGSPLTARELVVGALEAGAVAVDELERTPRAADLVANRLDRLDAAARHGLELVAVAEPLPLDWAPVATVDDLARLEAAGLVVTRGDPGREELWIGHPLYGEVLRAQTSALARRALLAELVERARERAGRDDEGRQLRLAMWCVELGLPVAPDDLRRAARRAFAIHRFDLAVAFLEAMPEDARDGDHRNDLMSARFYCDDLDGALGLLDAMESDPADDVERARAAEHRIIHAQVAGDLDAADEHARTALALLTDPDARARVETAAMATTVLRLPARDATDVLRTVLADGGSDRATDVAISAALTSVLLVRGQVEQADDVIERSRRIHEELWLEHSGALVPSHPANSTLFECITLGYLGRPGAGAELLAASEARAEREPGRLAAAHHALAGAALGYRTGRLGEARAHAERALTGYDATVHRLGFRWVMAAGFVTLAAAQSGDVDAALAARDLLEGGNPGRPLAGFVGLCRAWTIAATHGPGAATDALTATVRDALDEGELLWGVEGAWTLARLGAPEAIPADLRDVRDAVEGDLLLTWLDAVDAARAVDGVGLDAAGERLAGLGCELDAAEAYAAASRAWIAAGEPRRATGSARLAREAARACGAITPGLVLPDAPVSLTRREREVAALAAEGTPAKEIAERLFISERTVTNHLQRVYDKLGVSSRRELRAALTGED